MGAELIPNQAHQGRHLAERQLLTGQSMPRLLWLGAFLLAAACAQAQQVSAPATPASESQPREAYTAPLRAPTEQSMKERGSRSAGPAIQLQPPRGPTAVAHSTFSSSSPGQFKLTVSSSGFQTKSSQATCMPVKPTTRDDCFAHGCGGELRRGVGRVAGRDRGSAIEPRGAATGPGLPSELLRQLRSGRPARLRPVRNFSWRGGLRSIPSRF